MLEEGRFDVSDGYEVGAYFRVERKMDGVLLIHVLLSIWIGF